MSRLQTRNNSRNSKKTNLSSLHLGAMDFKAVITIFSVIVVATSALPQLSENNNIDRMAGVEQYYYCQLPDTCTSSVEKDVFDVTFSLQGCKKGKSNSSSTSFKFSYSSNFAGCSGRRCIKGMPAYECSHPDHACQSVNWQDADGVYWYARICKRGSIIELPK